MILDTLGRGPRADLLNAPSEVADLVLAPHQFYLTGSRYFGCARPDSDWDFIVQDSPALVEFLKDKGFEPMGNPQYDGGDGMTRGIFEKGKVQVQVMMDAPAKVIARNILSANFAEEHRVADKHTRELMWRDCIRLAQTIKALANPIDIAF